MKLGDLTYIQKRFYYSIKDFIEKNGYSPSYRELARLNGINSVATVNYHMKRLKDKGYIDYQEGRCRTVKIIK